MSLGIKSLRRVQPESLGYRGLSSIPRESRPVVAISTISAKQNAINSRCRRGQIRSQSTRPAENAPPGLAVTGPASDADPALGPKTRALQPAPSTLVERLANVPVRRHGPGESILVPPLIEYRRREETLRSRNKRHKALTAQLRFDRLRAAKRAPEPDWRVVLQYLLSSTPKVDREAAHESVALTIPKAGAEALQSDAENNLWDIRSRTGCSIQAQWAEEGENFHLMLSGSRSAVDAAIQDMLKVTMIVKVEHHVEGAETAVQNSSPEVGGTEAGQDSLATIRPTRTAGALGEYTLTTSVDNIPTPEAWTKESFEQYAAALTNGRLAPNLARQLYPPNVSHQERVIQRLHQVFNDPAARPAVSSAALKMALAYMAREGTRYRTDIQALFVRMEMLGLRMDVGVFDILAESAVKARDLGGFQAAIRLLTGRGYQPTLRTWILFLKLIEAEEVKRYVLHAMDQKGLFHVPMAMKVIAQEMAEHDTDRAILLGKDLKTFLAEQDALYGHSWPSRNATNRILEVFGRYGRFDDMATLLDRAFADPRMRPDEVTLNIALTHCHAHRSFPAAVATLRRFEAHGIAAPPGDSLAYHLLFEMAWRTRRPHALDLVWRYAALIGCTSHRMRARAAVMLRTGRRSNTVYRSVLGAPVSGSEGSGSSVRHAADAITRGNTQGKLLLSDFERERGPAEAFHLRHGTDAVAVLLAWYRGQGLGPAAPLSDLLSEALDRDAAFYEDIKAGRELTVDPVAVPVRVVRGGGRTDSQ